MKKQGPEVFQRIYRMISSGLIPSLIDTRGAFIDFDSFEITFKGDKKFASPLMKHYINTVFIDILKDIYQQYTYYGFYCFCPSTESIEFNGESFTMKTALTLPSRMVNIVERNENNKRVYKVTLVNATINNLYKDPICVTPNDNSDIFDERNDILNSECGKILDKWEQLQLYITAKKVCLDRIVNPYLTFESEKPAEISEQNKNALLQQAINKIVDSKLKNEGWTDEDISNSKKVIDVNEYRRTIVVQPDYKLLPFQYGYLVDALKVLDVAKEEMDLKIAACETLGMRSPNTSNVVQRSNVQASNAVALHEDKRTLQYTISNVNTQIIKIALKVLKILYPSLQFDNLKLSAIANISVDMIILLHEKNFISTELAKHEILKTTGIDPDTDKEPESKNDEEETKTKLQKVDDDDEKEIKRQKKSQEE